MMKRIILILALLVSNFAQAGLPALVLPNHMDVAGDYSRYFPPGQTGFVPDNYSSTPAPKTDYRTRGVNVNVSGAATMVKDGTQMKIPVAIKSTVTSAAVSGAAIAAWRIAKAAPTAIGVGIAAWEIYNAYKESGLQTCPPPDFFCKAQDTSLVRWYSGYSPCRNVDPSICTLNDVADSVVNAYKSGGWTIVNLTSVDPGTSTGIDRIGYVKISKGQDAQSLQSSTVTVNGTVISTSSTNRPATEPEIQQAGDTDMGSDDSGAKAKKYWDAANKADAASRAMGDNGISPSVMVPSGSETTVTAPPVTTSKTTTGTETFTDPNGVPQTRTTEQTTTVTPTSSGTGSSTSITYNTTNNTTTTTTNNTSTSTNNPPTVETKTENTKVDPLPVTPTEFPKDYNKEVTQLKIADELAGTNAPAAPADQEARQKTAVDKTNTDLDTSFKGIPDAFTSDKNNWFSWVWTAPIGTCNSSDYSGTVHGYAVSWGGFCEWVPKIRDAIGWLFALYGAIVIYGQIFKGNE